MKLEEFECRKNIDLDEYYGYFSKIKSEMEDPTWLGDLTKEDIKFFVEVGSVHWTFFDEGKMVCSFMYIEPSNEGIRELDLDYDEEECGEVGPMFVSKEYRGNNLQYQMFKKMEEYCKKRNLKYIVTTASPENTYSFRNMEKAGYEKVGCKVLERGPRNIYVKKI